MPSTHGYRRDRAIRVRGAAASILALALTACAATPAGPQLSGPGGLGIVAAAAEPKTAFTVTEATACELVVQSPTLAGLGATATPVDTGFVLELSQCQLELVGVEPAGSSITVGLLTADDAATTANPEYTPASMTLVLLPELGEHGHFLGPGQGIDPASNPRFGSLSATAGEYGVSYSWGVDPSALTFEMHKQAVRELLDAMG